MNVCAGESVGVKLQSDIETRNSRSLVITLRCDTDCLQSGYRKAYSGCSDTGDMSETRQCLLCGGQASDCSRNSPLRALPVG